MSSARSPAPADAWVRETRRFLVGALVFLSFLAGASLLGIRAATKWALWQHALRMEAEVRAFAELSAGAARPDFVYGVDPRLGSLLRGHGALQAALFGSDGTLLSQAAFLPAAPLAPVRLEPDEIPRGDAILVTRTRVGHTDAVGAAAAVDGGGRIVRVLYDAGPVVAAERMLAVFTVAIPAGAVLLVVLVAPLARRLLGPLRALAETARGAEGLVTAQPESEGPGAALSTFRRTIEELRRRTEDLERMRRDAESRADELAVTAETLVRSHPGGLLVIRAGGELREVNPRARELLALPAAPATGPAIEALRDWPSLGDAVARVLAGEPTLAQEAAGPGDSEARRIAVTAVPVVDARANLLGALVFLEDRTSVRRLERELSFRRELAALGEMSAGIAHEFRNATATILGYARLAGAAADEPARARHLERLRAEAEHVARVTGDFLLFARPEQVQLEEVDLGALAEEVVAEASASSPGVSVEVAGELPVLTADGALLRRALGNLVRNGAEAAGAGGRVVIGGERTPEGAALVRVEDSGPGVGPEALPRLFVPFSSSKPGGTGLGLSLVAKIAALHGATVSAGRSGTLGGASFTIAFPRPPAG